MALRWLDSFDNIDATGNGLALVTKYDASRSSAGPAVRCIPGTVLNPVRTGNGMMDNFSSGTLETKPLGVVGTTAIVGFGLYIPASTYGPGFAATNRALVDIREEDDTTHTRLGIVNGTGLLTVYRDTTLLATASGMALTHSTWYYIELMTTIHDTLGTYEVHIDGVAVTGLTASGVDTRNGGAGTWNRVALRNPWTSALSIRNDDFYICDGSGARCNTFLGIQKVGSLLAVADSISSGSVHNFACLSGSDHGAMVDDPTPDGDTTYTFSSVVGDIELVKVPTPTLTGTTRGIQINRYVRKTDAGVRQTAAVVRRGGVNYVQATQDPLTTYSYLSVPLEVDPSTGIEWTGAGIAAGEYGEKIVT